MIIVLCRHGSTDGNVAGGFLSRGDPPLNALGRQQSGRASAALRDIAFDTAFASPMRRCVETLDIVAPHVARRHDHALREIDFGSWEGRTVAWLEANDAAALAQRRRNPVDFRPEGGESFRDVAQRLQPFADALRNAAHERVLLVAHRGSLGVLERLLRSVPLESQTVVPLEPGEFHIVEL